MLHPNKRGKVNKNNNARKKRYKSLTPQSPVKLVDKKMKFEINTSSDDDDLLRNNNNNNNNSSDNEFKIGQHGKHNTNFMSSIHNNMTNKKISYDIVYEQVRKARQRGETLLQIERQFLNKYKNINMDEETELINQISQAYKLSWYGQYKGKYEYMDWYWIQSKVPEMISKMKQQSKKVLSKQQLHWNIIQYFNQKHTFADTDSIALHDYVHKTVYGSTQTIDDFSNWYQNNNNNNNNDNNNDNDDNNNDTKRPEQVIGNPFEPMDVITGNKNIQDITAINMFDDSENESINNNKESIGKNKDKIKTWNKGNSRLPKANTIISLSKNNNIDEDIDMDMNNETKESDVLTNPFPPTKYDQLKWILEGIGKHGFENYAPQLRQLKQSSPQVWVVLKKMNSALNADATLSWKDSKKYINLYWEFVNCKGWNKTLLEKIIKIKYSIPYHDLNGIRIATKNLSTNEIRTITGELITEAELKEKMYSKKKNNLINVCNKYVVYFMYFVNNIIYIFIG